MGVEKIRRPIVAPHYTDFENPDAFGNQTPNSWVWVEVKDDLPTPVVGVISLMNRTTYFFTEDVDLSGSRLLLGQNTVILGASSENATITSTGLSASTALITGAYTFPFRNISITHGTALDLSAIDGDQVLDWQAVNFVDCAIIGTIDGYNNAIFTACAILGSANLTFTGAMSTIGWDGTIFVGIAGQTTIILDSSLVLSTRFRIIYSALVSFGGATALNVSTSATIPVEGYILDTCAFSGGATYTAGVQFNDNKSRFVNNSSIQNSAALGGMSLVGSVTLTTISVSDTPVKVLGTTIDNSITQRFDHTPNRMTYTGALTRDFSVQATVTATSGNNKELSFYVAVNGTVDTATQSATTTSGNGRSEGVSVQGIVLLAPEDYVEIWCENNTDTSNITVENLNVILGALN